MWVELVSRAAPRDAAVEDRTLSQVYREHADFVWRAVVRLGVHEAQASDAVQEVFLVVRRRWSDLDPAAPPRPWLYGIARGVAANTRRSQQRAQRRLAKLEPPNAPPSPQEQLERREAAQLVDRFLSTLHPTQREVFVLIEIEGMAGPDVARALGENLNSIYSRLRLARARFRTFAAEAVSPQQRCKA